MCGRYGLYDISEDDILEENLGYEFKPNYNAAPTQAMPTILNQDGKLSVAKMVWGIPRTLGKDVTKNIFNTRSEKAFERFWGKTTKSNRCLIPANGFYEWKTTSTGKVPYWIHPTHGKLFYFAGIYDLDPDGVPHYSILTTTPNHIMEPIHNRMPVMLAGDSKDLWLNPKETEAAFLEELLKPAPDSALEMYEVSKEVNVARTNNSHLMLPVNSA